MKPIPQPKPEPLIGNIRDMDMQSPIQGLMRLALTYGPIFALDLPGRRMVVISSRALVNEVCDESRFDKKIHAALQNIRDFAGDGLFTAYSDEPNWGKAHRILMPAFGPIGIRGMFDEMLDIAGQMLTRWERFGPNAVIDVPDNMTRLTLDTIALCGFNYRFNSFYQNEMHPFVGAMVDALGEAGARGRRPEMATRMMLLSRRKYEEDIRLLHEIAGTLIAERRLDANAAGKKDLLALMLEGRDPVTGEGLSDENIRNQMVTFLIAGHETTSGLLSFALYLLLKNPAVLKQARAEVDAVLGNETPRVEQMAQLRFIEQSLMESLRLWPTAPAFGLRALSDTVIGGEYRIAATDTVLILVPSLHRDPTVWGQDGEAFRPERFAQEAFEALPVNSWKPFGHGQRACIGRPFAMLEAQLVLATILQRFDIAAEDPGYQLKVKETLTLKPDGFRIRARRRGDQAMRSAVLPAPQKPLAGLPVRKSGTATPLLVLYGSNTGSSEAFAQRIASDAPAQGYKAIAGPMDDHEGQLPKDGAVVVITASYEGRPPDNARQFLAWLDTLRPGDAAGVRYTVFGCGNRQWARTYQAIPKRVDAALQGAGATQAKSRGEADASGDFFGAFDAWYTTFWSDLAATFGKEAAATPTGAQLEVEVVKGGRSAILGQSELRQGEIVENRELVNMTSPLGRSKRHFEIALPAEMSYRTGDYLSILPRNPVPNVERALRRYGFAPDSQVIIHKAGGSLTSLPVEYPVGVSELLSSYVELGQPATRIQIEALAAATACPPDRQALEALSKEDAYHAEVLEKRVSVLELLERFPACGLSFSAFLAMLPPMRARQYSISSSPLWNPAHCTLTVAILDAPAMSGQGRYLGVASTYLAAAGSGSRVSVAVRPSHASFHPPASPEVPIVMVCAGTGLAPFRGFVQERAIQAAGGQLVGPALLFFGCSHPDVDLLYRDEFAAWEADGIVSLRPAFARVPDGGVKYVQDRVWQDRAEIEELFRQGASVYVCGDGRRMAPAVRDTFVRIYEEATGASPEAAESWADKIERETGRYVADVFA